MNKLELEIKKLKEENSKLRKELDEALAVIKELKDEMTKLKKNSETSSKPPSLDYSKAIAWKMAKGMTKIGVQAKHNAKRITLNSLNSGLSQ